eukprot:TRINITY_DN5116_c0_g1_i1.p2 TRINITY_DN5116_c0_g1~~TRINITY_DN5116_c0_g1_i1.p2  ORF type:complete len:165 (+),score=53.30 TRINITY_DN5116_c0_g1_i1:967-1461(+)
MSFLHGDEKWHVMSFDFLRDIELVDDDLSPGTNKFKCRTPKKEFMLGVVNGSKEAWIAQFYTLRSKSNLRKEISSPEIEDKKTATPPPAAAKEVKSKDDDKKKKEEKKDDKKNDKKDSKVVDKKEDKKKDDKKKDDKKKDSKKIDPKDTKKGKQVSFFFKFSNK